MSIFLRIPATSANLGPGFDRLGLALSLYLEVYAAEAPEWSFELEGEGAESLARDESNLIASAYQKGCARWGWPPTPFRLKVRNQVPLNRGLGSSATAIVAGLCLALLNHQNQLDRDLLTQAASEMEGHPDNVAPAIWGGLQLAVQPLPGLVMQEMPIHPELKVLVVIPESEAKTEAMRAILPAQPSADVLAQTETLLQQLLHGLAHNRLEDLASSSLDVRHQPYRLAVQPMSQKIFDAFRSEPWGAGVFLSGSGPTLGCWIQDPHTAELAQQRLSQLEVPVRTYLLAPDHQGVYYEKTHRS
ncbi:MAG: homoserine kinase [Acidobacteria bacterium]|nr:homoserine kinase [Acidobacteriota bacterium]MCB9397569.1 homoserine kinase [Acidobacteriota bacterium]